MTAQAALFTDPRGVACPQARGLFNTKCGTKVGEPCRNHVGWPLDDFHAERVLLSGGTVAAPPEPDPVDEPEEDEEGQDR